MATVKIVLEGEQLDEQLFQSLNTSEHAPETPKKNSVHFSEDHPEKPSPAPRRRLSRDNYTRETGMPGSRKYRRYLNTLELLDQALSDSESDVDMEVVIAYPSRSMFADIYEDPVVREAWEPFIEITFEEQEKIFNLILEEKGFRDECRRKSRKASSHRQNPTSPEECFKLIRSFQGVIRRFAGDPIVDELEVVIVDFILSHRQTMSLQNRDCSQRFIIYCICCYYSLCTDALEELSEGKHPKSLNVHKRGGSRLPEMRLSEYIMRFK